jgi:hypothetical protein
MTEANLVSTFEKIKGSMQEYESSFKSLNNSTANYDLWSIKGITAGNRAKLYEKFFAGAAIRKNYVAFYLMALYKSNLKEMIDPELLKLYNGKY